MEERHEITLSDGRVFEECTVDEWVATSDTLSCDGGDGPYYRRKVQAPRTHDGRVSYCKAGHMGVLLPNSWDDGARVTVTEVLS